MDETTACVVKGVGRTCRKLESQFQSQQSPSVSGNFRSLSVTVVSAVSSGWQADVSSKTNRIDPLHCSRPAQH